MKNIVNPIPSTIDELKQNTRSFTTKSEQYNILIQKYQTEVESLPEKQSYLGHLEMEMGVLNNTYSYISNIKVILTI